MRLSISLIDVGLLSNFKYASLHLKKFYEEECFYQKNGSINNFLSHLIRIHGLIR